MAMTIDDSRKSFSSSPLLSRNPNPTVRYLSSPISVTEKLYPDSFVTQPKLLSVNLTNNLIDDVLPGTFANMTRLVRLILTRNRLSGLQPNSMAGERELPREA